MGNQPSADSHTLSPDDWRLLVEAVQDYAIYRLDPEGRVSSWNAGAQSIKGYRADEIVGQHFSRFFSAEDAQAGRPSLVLESARSKGRYEEEAFRIRKDGSRFWAHVVLTAIRDAQDRLVGFAKVTRDLSARVAAEQSARELIREQAARAAAEAGEARLTESEGRYRALSQRLSVILEGVADGISVQDLSGTVVFANTAAAKISGHTTVEGFLRAPTESFRERFEMFDEQGQPFPWTRLPGRLVLAGEPEASALMRIVDKQTGHVWWSRLRARPVLGDDGTPELAVNIYHDVTAQRRREEHERYVSQATVALSESLDYGAMLATLARVLVPGLADWCSIQVLEGGDLKPVTVAHVDPAKIAFAEDVARRYPPDPTQERGVWHVLRTGTSELYAHIPDELLAHSARDAEHLAILREVGMKSVLIVPLLARNQPVGTISLVSAENGRQYDELDLTLAKELGERAGQAIENARLYAAERKSRAQMSLLAEAGEVFASAEDYGHMLEQVVHIALPVLGDIAFFDLLEANEVRRTAAAHDDPEMDALIKTTHWVRSERTDKNLCALSTGESAMHANIDDAWIDDVATSPEHAALLRKLRLCSMLTVPMRFQGTVLGAITLCHGRSGRHHTQDDLRLAEELARRAAISVTQMRLYAQARAAAERAEEANRVKDEFLATVSHELRTPLNAILGWSVILGGHAVDPQTARKGVDVIQRNATAQAKIIDDILDVSRIITGKLHLDTKPVDLVHIVQDAIDVVKPSATAKQLRLTLRAGSVHGLMGDPDRLQQVVWNLLSNAVKFSDREGTISVELGQEGSRAVLTVSDKGRGIDPAFLPFVFDRFKQEDSSTTRRVGGLGLGLAIVRHLVELHGGQVDATSAGIGHGATFRVSFPIRAVAAYESDLPRESTPNDASTLRGKRVLVVDDEPDARELVETVLSAAGASVRTASSASEALAIIPHFRPDVLVSDVGMPGEDGYTFLGRLRASQPELARRLPSLALTAYTRAEDRAQALAAGFTMHLGKPVKPADLLAAVQALTDLEPG